ncbi:hypothetical protein AB0K00_27120 [Dactylosporangium sp. NPDC049525]|uniref:hypothetical protein n=1 Tax=Dactylosporangium sp. NPDC049525 TaxID=3154730 RepID=UPI0034336780
MKWLQRAATHCVYAPIPVERTDLGPDQVDLEPYASYFRLWLSEMFLTDRVNWVREVHPAVHAEVRLQFGNQQVSFSKVAQPPTDRLSQGVRLNYRLTELLPYNGGVVEVDAALLALKGKDYLGTAIGVLKQFSGLVAPPLGQVIGLASTLTAGTRDLLEATGGDVHLGFHQEWISAAGGQTAATLRPGYFAVILASAEKIAVERLSVQNGQLYHQKPGGTTPEHLLGYDYMLLRVEGRRDRDDWRLRDIQEPLDAAFTALSEVPANRKKARTFLMAAVAAAMVSSDLATLDRRRVVDAIKAQYEEFERSGLGVVGGEHRDLNAIMAARAMSVERARALGRLTEEEAYA